MKADAAKIKIRRALPSDKKTVLTFCRRTWGEWGDYIDKVWDEWAKDKKGFLAVASLAGRPVGTGKLTVINRREIWLEGLRVDRAYRGHGISHLLTAFLAKEALKRGAKTIRYATGAMNSASLHIGNKWGLKPVGKFSILYATADGRRNRIFERSKEHPRALDRIKRLVSSAPFTKAMAGLASRGWTFFQVDRHFLAASLKNRELFFSPTPPGFLVASTERKNGRLLIKLVADLGPGALEGLLSGARRLAYDLGLPRIRLVVPVKRSILRNAKAAGYRQEDKGFFHVVMEADFSSERARQRVGSLIKRYL